MRELLHSLFVAEETDTTVTYRACAGSFWGGVRMWLSNEWWQFRTYFFPYRLWPLLPPFDKANPELECGAAYWNPPRILRRFQR